MGVFLVVFWWVTSVIDYKTLGVDYTREAIEQRIKDAKNIPASPVITGPTYFRIWRYNQKLGLIENTHSYLLFIQSPYQRQKAAIIDAKKVAVFNVATKHHIGKSFLL